MLDQPLQWKSRLFIQISPRTLHSITAKPDLQNRVKTSKRKSPNLRTWCAVTNFLPSWITVPEHSVGLLQNTHTQQQQQHLYTQMQEETHRAHTHKTAVSHTAELRHSERAAAHPNLKNLLVSPTLKGARGTEFETTSEHMSYWSDQSKQCCRHTNTFYMSQRGRRQRRDNNWVILAFVCSSKPLSRQWKAKSKGLPATLSNWTSLFQNTLY